ncbi:MAG TPA: valine--tRNA ligase [bacterium]|nr:valine--tRNA ligase [bacterium]
MADGPKTAGGREGGRRSRADGAGGREGARGSREDGAELPKTYDPAATEERWYRTWDARGYFRAVPDPSRRPYTIMMPLPNVTGELHMGHALNNGVQDCLIRWSRMRGHNALYQPGMDHAGIAVHVVMDRRLAKEGLTRFSLGRERFLEETWKWREEIGQAILGQMRRLLLSCDWKRTIFTMDPGYSRAVAECFIRLYNKGFIYKGKRMINWCPKDQTSISDLEVEYVEEQSTLYYVRYPGAGGDDGVVIATQRPETILADVAVAVHPGDERYKKLVGTQVVVPIVNRPVPVIADRRVERGFGTGAVKITPGHDLLDYEIGVDHKLPVLIAFDPHGRMTMGGPRYEGLDRMEARQAAVDDLRSAGLLVREEPYTTNIGRCDRCKTTIEPYISDQWFCRMKALAAPAIGAVRDGRVRFHPGRWTKFFLDWMDQIRDWNISRQLWWGHQIPMWHCECGEMIAGIERPKSCPKCGGTELTRDPDVLDTWFSSALWPMATLGWPDETADLEYFYPTNTLATARDIIFLWVARMIMFGLELRHEIPFTDVYINPTVLNIEGRRMSKSLGTGMDPLLLIDRYGADSLRFALLNRCTGEQDLRFSEKMVEDTRNFANKIWNAARLARLHLEGHDVPAGRPRGARTLPNRWILDRFARAASDVTAALEAYEFHTACHRLYEFIWSEFCDWYLEMAKVDLERAAEQPAAETRHVLGWVLGQTMALLHPVMPAITEEIWQALPHEGETVMRAPWPEPPDAWRDAAAETAMAEVMEIAGAVRGIRAELGLATQPVDASLHVADGDRERVDRLRPYLAHLVRLDPDRLPVRGLDEHGAFGISSPYGRGRIEIHVEAPELRAKARERFEKQLTLLERDLAGVTRRLEDPAFVQKAPAEVVAADRARAQGLVERRGTLRRYLADLAPPSRPAPPGSGGVRPR